MADLQQLQSLEKISQECIELLDSIWIIGVDLRFAESIKQLQSQLENHSQFREQHTRILLYRATYNINIDQAVKVGTIGTYGVNHIADTWRVLLLEINLNIQRMINQLLYTKQRSMGLYIKTLQDAFSRKNRIIKYHRTLIHSLTSTLKDLQTAPELEYEILKLDSSSGESSSISNYLINWF